MNIIVVSFCVVALSWFNYAMQVNVTVGETVVLVCSLITDDSSVQWVRMDLQVIYSNGDVVNPNLLNQTRYDVIGNQENGEFNFQIKQVMKYDEGIYRCDTKIEGKAVSEVVSLNVYENQDNSENNCTETGNHNGFSLYTYMCIFGGVISAVVIIPLTTTFGFNQVKHLYGKGHRINNLPDQGTEAVNNYDDIDDIEISEIRVFNRNNGDDISIDQYVNEIIYTEPGSHVLPALNSNSYQTLTDNRQSTNVNYDELAIIFQNPHP